MDEIFIRNLTVRAILGVNPQERRMPQRVVISIRLGVDTRPAGLSDRLDETVDYAQLAKEVRLHAQQAKRLTVEALAEDIAHLCLQRRGVRHVSVRVEKPDAVQGAESVGVEIERSSPEA
ncbi:MAG: dihydroneopterin aldolase [Anaerolineales bacterium]|nr:dihydroneopterin aldolase [Anaerolineales bacterium]